LSARNDTRPAGTVAGLTKMHIIPIIPMRGHR